MVAHHTEDRPVKWKYGRTDNNDQMVTITCILPTAFNADGETAIIRGSITGMSLRSASFSIRLVIL